MSLLLDTVKNALSVTKPSTEVDATTMKAIERARARHKQWCPGWAESLAFVEGRQFVFRSRSGTTTTLNELDTSPGGAKPNYRARTVRNRVLDHWLSEVSAGTQRVPQYEVTPTSTDPEVMAAANLAEKVLMYLYDYLEVRSHLVEAYGYSVACGEGFIRPYWYAQGGNQLPPPPEPNPNNPDEVAEYDPQEELYEGDLCLDALGPDQVMWEPGSSFDDSPYHIIWQAQTIDYLKALPKFTGVELKPDVQGHSSFVAGQLNKSAAKGDMVMTTEWLKKPSPTDPKGQRFLIANGQKVVPDEDYPLVAKGPKGYEPCIHRMSYIRTPWRDRDMGLVEHLLDPQRTLNDVENKVLEWMKLALLPQLLVPRGAKIDKPTTEPGAVIRYDAISGLKPEWRQVPVIPESLFEIRRNAIEDMEAISSQRTPPGGVDSGKGLASFIESEARRGQMQTQALADFHSRLGKHLLLWVQQRYTEDRLLAIEGRHGADYIPEFKGTDLREQTSVRVLPGSIEPLTRAAVEQKIMNFAQLGWISKEEGLAAINNGTAGDLIEDYELDVQKANRQIQKMVAMGNGQPGGDVPVADEFDNHQVALSIINRWRKTREYEAEPPPVQEAASLLVEQHQKFLDDEQMKAQEQQNAQAESMGAANAAKPQTGAKPLPSLPSVNGQS